MTRAGGIKFRSVTGYQTGNTMYRADLDGTASNIASPVTGTIANSSFYDNVNERQFSQEFNIISPDNKRFTWLLGAFGMWNTYIFPAAVQQFHDQRLLSRHRPCAGVPLSAEGRAIRNASWRRSARSGSTSRRT